MSEQQDVAKEVANAVAQHDVQFDRAGFSGSIPRYTCMSPGCNCATLVKSKYPNLIDWGRAKKEFMEKHPCSSIKDIGYQI